MAKATYHFPQDFMWGTATASYQVEGNKTAIFQRLGALNSWADHNAQIECNYDFTQTDDEGNAV